MTDRWAHLSRRSVLPVLGCGLVAGLELWAQPGLRYSLAVRPEKAWLGDPVVAELTCVASQGGAEAFSFEDASLELELRRIPSSSEPILDFPNRTVVQQGSLQVRMHPAGRQQLAREQRLQRTFELIRIYPRWILDTGDFEFSYRLGPEEHPFHTGPARLTIASGPAAIARLLSLLEHEDEAVRDRAAGLLLLMTAHVTAYNADASPEERREAAEQWREWWQTAGAKMPWNYQSQGATIGHDVAPASASGPGRLLGGIAYQRRGLAAASGSTIASILRDWLRSPSGDLLQGRRWIADQLVEYPPEDVMLDPGPEIAKLLTAAIAQIPSREKSASLVLATAAKMPDEAYIQSLADLEQQARRNTELRLSGYFAGGLLVVLDPGRTPVGTGQA